MAEGQPKGPSIKMIRVNRTYKSHTPYLPPLQTKSPSADFYYLMKMGVDLELLKITTICIKEFDSLSPIQVHHYESTDSLGRYFAELNQ